MGTESLTLSVILQSGKAPLEQVNLLDIGEAHLWQFDLNLVETEKSLWWSWLSSDERDRAQQFARPGVGDRFGLSRVGLRCLLGQYLNCSPTSIRFAHSDWGKPRIDEPRTCLQFNLSHSHNWVIYGISRCKFIGVDVERSQPRRRIDALIDRCLTPYEQQHLLKHPHQKQETFLHYWTLKEAYFKAVGIGLRHPINQVEMSLQPFPHLVNVPATLDGPPESANWSFHLWYPERGAIAAAGVGHSAVTFTLGSLNQLFAGAMAQC